jgi:Rod binding domain-containing protein
MEVAFAALAAPRADAHAPSQGELRAERAAREFEAVLISELLKPVLDQASAPRIVGGGGAGDAAFSGLLREEIAKAFAAHGGFGLAERVRSQLLELQAGGPGGFAGTN